MKFEYWTVAYRKRNGEKDIINNLSDEFHVIRNNWRYWYADPHLYTFEGKTYLFAEAYDRLKRRGVISYCVLQNQAVSKWKKVLDTGSHLSYPHIFDLDGDIVMIPESYSAEEISLYKAVQFPDKWEKKQVLATCVAVDSTVFCYNNTRWLLNQQDDRLTLYRFESRKLLNARAVGAQDMMNRPAGHLFWHNNKLLRPAQDCREGYGSALLFYDVRCVSDDSYLEELYGFVRPEDIKSDFKGTPKGMHTYNMSSDYEVIDLKCYKSDVWFYLMRPFWFIVRRIKRLINR